VLGAVVVEGVVDVVEPGRATFGTEVVVDGLVLADSCGRVATITGFWVAGTEVAGLVGYVLVPPGR
jgi:hypothetical protein